MEELFTLKDLLLKGDVSGALAIVDGLTMSSAAESARWVKEPLDPGE